MFLDTQNARRYWLYPYCMYSVHWNPFPSWPSLKFRQVLYQSCRPFSFFFFRLWYRAVEETNKFDWIDRGVVMSTRILKVSEWVGNGKFVGVSTDGNSEWCWSNGMGLVSILFYCTYIHILLPHLHLLLSVEISVVRSQLPSFRTHSTILDILQSYVWFSPTPRDCCRTSSEFMFTLLWSGALHPSSNKTKSRLLTNISYGL